jgi:hypothetical protein
MAIQNLEVTTESILSAVVRMPEDEFDKFVEKAKKLRAKSRKSSWTQREIEIIQKINECVISAEEQIRFDELVEKRRGEKIEPNELEELIVLTDKSEALNVERIENLIKLAKAKNVSLDEIMNRLGIVPPKTI